jgi:hypothetical protein
MKTFRTITIAFGIGILLQITGVSFAAAFPAAVGGTGTSTVPGVGQVAAGNGTSFCFAPSSTNGYVLEQSSTAPCGIAWALAGGSSTASPTVNLSGSSTPQNFPFWNDASGDLVSSSYAIESPLTAFGITSPTSTFNTANTSTVPDNLNPFNIDGTYGVPTQLGAPTLQNTQQPFADVSTTIITSFASTTAWSLSGSGSTLSTSTVNSPLGTPAPYVTTNGTQTLTNYQETSVGPYNFTGQQLVLWIYIASSTQLSELNFFASSNNTFSGGTAQVTEWSLYGALEQADPYGDYFQPGQWTKVVLPFYPTQDGASITTTSTFNQAAVDSFRFQVKDSGVAATVAIGGIGMVPQPPQGIVTLTFDDSYQDTFAYAYPTMSQYGYAGDVFDIPYRQVQSGDQTSTLGYMSVQEMQSMQNNGGWDIDCHTWDHPTVVPGIGNYDVQQLNFEYDYCKSFLVDNGLTSGENILAWPIGDYSTLAEAVAQRYFVVARSNVNRIPETLPAGNPWDLRVQEFNGVGLSTSTVLSTLQMCQAAKEWCIFEMHDVTPQTPSSTTQIATSTFSYMVQEINALGIPVKTLSQVINSYSSQPTNINPSSTPNTLAAYDANGYFTSALPSSTAIYYVDSNRHDSYSSNGSYLWPYKSLSAAIASSTGFQGYAYILSPGT